MNNSTSRMKLTNSCPHLKIHGKVDKQFNDDNSDDNSESAKHFSDSFSSLDPSCLAKSQRSSKSSSKKSFSESCPSLDPSSLTITTTNKSRGSSKSPSKKSFSASCSSLDPASLATATKSTRSSSKSSSKKKKKKKKTMNRSTSTDTLDTNMSVESSTDFWETEALFWHSISSMPRSSNTNRVNNKDKQKQSSNTETTNEEVDQTNRVWENVKSPEKPIPPAIVAKYARKPSSSVQPQQTKKTNAPSKKFDAKNAFKLNVRKLQTVIALSNNNKNNETTTSASVQRPRQQKDKLSKAETSTTTSTTTTTAAPTKFDAKKTFKLNVRKIQTIMALKTSTKNNKGFGRLEESSPEGFVHLEQVACAM